MGINCARLTKIELILNEIWKSYVQIMVLMASTGVLCSFLLNVFVKIHDFMCRIKEFINMCLHGYVFCRNRLKISLKLL
jgi:hypothetical protein